MVRIGINGFGRMGRLALRAGWQRAPLEFVQINEIGCDAHGSAHLLEFDSVHGRWPHACGSETEAVVVDGAVMHYSMQADLSAVDWSGCDIVIESTGKHHKRPDTLQNYFRQGVKKVLVAAPTDGALNMVYGVNDHWYEPAIHHLVTAASCTTNCLAPGACRQGHARDYRHRTWQHDDYSRHHQHSSAG